MEAEENLKTRFKENPCRGIVCGMDMEGRLVQLSWIMGRSPPSQNRLYVMQGSVLKTVPKDASKLENPDLIIYNAMRSVGGDHIVSNGNQTDTVINFISHSALAGRGMSPSSFYGALESRFCEPDPSIFTARITGFVAFGDDNAYISILRADPEAKTHWIETEKASGLTKEQFRRPGMTESQVNEAYYLEIGKLAGLDYKRFPTIRECFDRHLTPGVGYCVTTYAPGNSKELPSFVGEPFVVPTASLEGAMHAIWESLDPRWKVALAGKLIESECDSPIETIQSS